MTILGGFLDDARRWLKGEGEHAAGSGSLPGCDVSSFNGPPADWRTEAGRISFAAVKICELSTAVPYVNPDAAQDWSWLRANNKGRIGYLFARPDVSTAATASLFTSTLARLGLDDGDAVAIDLEVSCGKSPSEVAAWAGELAALLERDLHRVPLLYTYLSFAQEGNCAGLGHLPLWMSDPSRAKGHPRIPRPWKRYAIHQFSISGSLDRDVANYPDLAAFRAALGRRERFTVWKSDGRTPLSKVAGEHHATAAKVLHDTAAAGKAWPKEVHDWLDAILAGKVPPKGAEFLMPPK